jgi:Brp/Blh family beta-carotene 15,15'-monooxygenase
VKNKISSKKILFYYIIVVFLGAFSFYYFSKTSLIVFLIFSGYHFGEQQFQNIENLNKKTLILFQTVYGFFILTMLFYFHKTEVRTIVYEICTYKLDSNQIINLFWIVFSIFISLLVYIYTYNEKTRNQLLLELFYLLVFGIIFISSNLIWGFAIYFIFWHSIPSIIDQIGFLYGDYTHDKFIKYFKSAFLYWIMSLIGLGITYFIFKDFKLFNSLFFSFLAAITFPHVLVILKMFEDKKELSE